MNAAYNLDFLIIWTSWVIHLPSSNFFSDIVWKKLIPIQEGLDGVILSRWPLAFFWLYPISSLTSKCLLSWEVRADSIIIQYLFPFIGELFWYSTLTHLSYKMEMIKSNFCLLNSFVDSYINMKLIKLIMADLFIIKNII
jgi:hypothetical protein